MNSDNVISDQQISFPHEAQNFQTTDTIILLTVLFNVLIPKAGIKLGGIPLTLGNILLFYLLIRTYVKPRKIDSRDREFIFALMLFPLYCFFRTLIPLIAGTIGISGGMGAFPSLATNVIYPLIFPALIMVIKTEDELQYLVKVIIICIFATMIYDIIQAVFGISAVQIPGITVNYSDYAESPGGWWLKKYNGFSAVSKIFSTYQNGNLYGVNLLLFYPILSLYFRERAGIMIRFLLIVMLTIIVFITGSRTVWVGAGVYTYLLAIGSIERGKFKFKSFMITIIFIYFFVISSGFFVELFAERMGRLISSLNLSVFLSGGGRMEGVLRSFEWLFQNGNIIDFMFGVYGTDGRASAYEMTYFAMLFAYGLIGLILWLLPITLVSLRIRQESMRTGDKLLQGAYRGIFVYMACAFMDGGYWLPPTVINLWTMIAIAYMQMKFMQQKRQKRQKRILSRS